MCLCTRATYQVGEVLDGQRPGRWEVGDLAGQSLLISNIPGQNNLVKASSSRNASCPQLCPQLGSMEVTLKFDHLLGYILHFIFSNIEQIYQFLDESMN